MKEEQRLFLVQAKSAYAVYELLSTDPSLPHCHSLHYLQMATELLAKANAWRNSQIGKSHKALVPFLRSLSSNTKAQKQLGYEGQNENWKHTLRKIAPMAESLQKLAPPWPMMARMSNIPGRRMLQSPRLSICVPDLARPDRNVLSVHVDCTRPPSLRGSRGIYVIVRPDEKGIYFCLIHRRTRGSNRYKLQSSQRHARRICSST